eukprot:g4051.t1
MHSDTPSMDEGDIELLVLNWLRSRQYRNAHAALERELRSRNTTTTTRSDRIRSLHGILNEYMRLKHLEYQRENFVCGSEDVPRKIANTMETFQKFMSDYSTWRRTRIQSNGDTARSSATEAARRSNFLLRTPERSRKRATPRKKSGGAGSRRGTGINLGSPSLLGSPSRGGGGAEGGGDGGLLGALFKKTAKIADHINRNRNDQQSERDVDDLLNQLLAEPEITELLAGAANSLMPPDQESLAGALSSPGGAKTKRRPVGPAAGAPAPPPPPPITAAPSVVSVRKRGAFHHLFSNTPTKSARKNVVSRDRAPSGATSSTRNKRPVSGNSVPSESDVASKKKKARKCDVIRNAAETDTATAREEEEEKNLAKDMDVEAFLGTIHGV